MWISRRSAISSPVLSTCRAQKRFYTPSADCGPSRQAEIGPEAIIGFRVLAPLVVALQDPASAPTLAVHMNSRSSLEIEGVDLDSETSIALLSDMEILLL